MDAVLPGTQEMKNNTRMPPISQYFQCLIINTLSKMSLQYRDTFNYIPSVFTREVKAPAQRLPSLENSLSMCLE